MDRVKQLSNVSFGGAWSEQIAGNEAVQRSLVVLEMAVKATLEVDLRGNDQTEEALKTLVRKHPKGVQLREAWDRALGLPLGVQRQAELRRIYLLFKAAFSMG